MLTITRSIYGAQIQSYLNMGKIHAVPTPNTTMNELYNIHNLTLPSANDPQTALSYFCIGNKGHRFTTNSDGVTKSTPIPHSATDAGLYNPLPFIMRPVGNDLTTNERLKYAMRVPVTLDNGDVYWAYYLKKIETGSITADLKRIVVEDGVKTISAFVPDNSNLTPQIPTIPSGGAITTDGTFLSVVSTLDLSLSVNDAVELANVADLLYNDPDYAIISEIGLVSAIIPFTGVSLLTPAGTPVGTGVIYKEALQATITSFTSTYHQLSYGNQGLDLFLDLGATEPLFGPTVTSVQGA